MTAQARSVKVTLSLETAQAIAASKQFGTEMTRAMDQAEKSSHRANQSLDRVATTSRNVALGAGAIVVATGKMAMDWESQFAGVEKTVDGTREQIAGLEDDLRGMARTMPATHQEIAATAEAAGQLGVATDDITEFTRTMVQFGETTNVTATDGATSIAQFMNVLQSAPDAVDNIAATIVDLGNKGASTEGQILDMAQRVAGAGTTIGATEQDILALSAAMANLGIESELGGGAVQRILTNINSEVKSGGSDLEGFARTAGMSAEEFATAWENRPVAAFDAFLQGLGEVQATGGDVVSVLSELGIEGTQNLQVMLRLAGAGDTLTTALDQSGEAWASNSALIEEYSKRAATTESEVTVAMNNIRDAGISVGESLLPLGAEVADGIAATAGAVGSLPGPIRQVAGEMLGITAITAGGAWFGIRAVTGVIETRQAIADLATTSPRASRALGILGKAAAGLAALTTVAAGIRAIQEATDESLPGVNEFTVDLLELRDGRVAGLTGEFDSLGESIRRITDKSDAEAFGDILQKPFTGLVGEAGSLREATAEIELIDEALAGLVSQASPEVAAEALDAIAEASGLTAVQVHELVGLMPQYEEALASVSAEQLLAGDSAGEAANAFEQLWGPLLGTEDGMNGVATATDSAAASAGASVEAFGQQSEEMEKLRDAAYDTAHGFFNLGESLNDSQVSLGDWIGEMEEQAKALRDFTDNAAQAAEKNVRQGLIKALQEAGPEGALRMRELAGATEDEIGRANRAWGRGQREIEKYVESVTAVPETATTDVEANTKPAEQKADGFLDLMMDINGTTATTRVDAETGAAMSALGAVRSELSRIVSKSITVTVNRVGSAVGGLLGSFGGAGADGMTVPGQRQPYGDKVLIWAAPGEEIITNRHGEADQFRADRAAGLIPAYADGGTAGDDPRKKRKGPTKRELVDRAYGRFAVDLEMGVSGVRSELDDLRDALRDAKVPWTDAMRAQSKELTRSARQYERLNESLDEARAAQRAFRDDVAKSFDHDIFGNGVAGLRLQLEADRNDSRAMEAALAQLEKLGLDVRDDPRTKGVNEAAFYQELAASGDLNTAQQMAGMSKAEIRQLEQLYASTGAAQQSLGQAAASDVFDKQIKSLEREMRRERREFMGEVKDFLGRRLPKTLEESSYRGTRDGIADRNRNASQQSRTGR